MIPLWAFMLDERGYQINLVEYENKIWRFFDFASMRKKNLLLLLRVVKTQPDHWTMRMVDTRLTA